MLIQNVCRPSYSIDKIFDDNEADPAGHEYSMLPYGDDAQLTHIGCCKIPGSPIVSSSAKAGAGNATALSLLRGVVFFLLCSAGRSR